MGLKQVIIGRNEAMNLFFCTYTSEKQLIKIRALVLLSFNVLFWGFVCLFF